jgi:hypothetical protein
MEKKILETSICSSEYVDAMGPGIAGTMPPGSFAKSLCVNEGQSLSLEGTLETMWHTSVLIEVTPCYLSGRSNCHDEETIK